MIRKRFEQLGDFRATQAAEAWCEEHGISVGRMQGNAPRGLLYGRYDIQKWRNLTADDERNLHGRMTGDPRYGPVIVTIDETKSNR